MTATSREFWRGRSVLVTGHTGFLGSWTCLALHRLGATVHGYALAPPSEPSLFDVAEVASAMTTSRTGDVADLDALSRTVAETGPEIVLHLAAQPIVGRAFADPLGTLETNVIGTANLLESVRRRPGVRGVLLMTTDKVYRNREAGRPFVETDELGGNEPYGVSKACAELVADAYRGAYFGEPRRPLPVATVRAGNLIGGGDWGADRLVPDAVRAFSSARPLHIRRPRAIRPWQHVLDAVRGCLALARTLIERPAVADGAWNFGPRESDCRQVGWVADRLAELWGGTARWAHAPVEAGPEATTLLLDSARARDLLGWTRLWGLETGLEETVRWYRTWHDGGDTASLTNRQLERALDE